MNQVVLKHSAGTYSPSEGEFEIRDIQSLKVGGSAVIERTTAYDLSQCQRSATRAARRFGMVVKTQRLCNGVRVERVA